MTIAALSAAQLSTAGRGRNTRLQTYLTPPSTEPFSHPLPGAQNSARNGYPPRNASNASNASVCTRSRSANTCLTARADALGRAHCGGHPGAVSAHDALTRRLDDFDRQIDAALAPWKAQRRLLETLPGIDRVASAAILIETGPEVADVFGTARRFAAWTGLCPGNHQSAILVECARGAVRTHGRQFHNCHKALTVRRGYKRALVAIAHRQLSPASIVVPGCTLRCSNASCDAPAARSIAT